VEPRDVELNPRVFCVDMLLWRQWNKLGVINDHACQNNPVDCCFERAVEVVPVSLAADRVVELGNKIAEL
jgi:hypothetical protein